MEKENKVIEQIKDLWQYLSESSKRELKQILMFGEKYKKEGERLKAEFWKNHKREDLDVLLWNYKANRSKFMEQLDSNEKQMIRSLGGSLFERFMEEYLRTFIFYSGWVDIKGKKADCIKYEYEDFQAGNLFMDEGKYILLDFGSKNLGVEGIKPLIKKIKLTEGSYLKLDYNSLFCDGAEFLAKNIQLKEGMSLILDHNEIGAEGAKAIAENMELKEGVFLDISKNIIGSIGAKQIAENMKLKSQMKINLLSNEIGDEGAKAISKMELKEGVKLNLSGNKIGDGGAQAIAQNMKLKKGVCLNLSWNEIGYEGIRAIAENMKLEEGVELDLSHNPNEIWDEGAKVLIGNMELKEGVKLNLRSNDISDVMKIELKKWEKSYEEKGIHCEVLVD